MTEHERRVNDGDIRAFVNQDKEHLYSKVPGYIKYGDAHHDRYLDQAYNK